MIKTNIAAKYPHHIVKSSDESLYLADYTKQTVSARCTEVFKGNPPSDIEYVTLQNDTKLMNGFIIFDNKSFTDSNGNALSQCECVVFPEKSASDSWILFVELKYSGNVKNNIRNLRKAVSQLLKTRTYYYRNRIFSKTNLCYLLASLPKQRPPFTNIPQTDLTKLKKKHNIILYFGNETEVLNAKKLKMKA
jgi:hypothetical protein